MNNDPMLEMYVFESVQMTEQLEGILIEGEQLGGFNTEHINEIFRIMHTLKGSAAMMEYTAISSLAHSLEDMFYYIRENSDASPDWSAIADICLDAVDFFKAEVAKVQNHLPSDGDNSALLARSKACLDVLTGKAPAAPPAESAVETAAEPPPEEEKTVQTEESAPPEEGLNVISIRVFFQEDCKMENIRAYQIANSLAEVAERIETVPADFLEDCSDDIIAAGAQMTVYTKENLDAIKEIVNQAIFVKSFEIGMLEKPKAEEALPAAVEETPPAQEPSVTETAAPEAPPAAEPEKTPVSAVSAEKPPPPPPAPAKSLPPMPAPEVKASVINVNVDKLDRLMDLMGEIVISVAMVIGSPDLEGLKLDTFEKSASQLLKNTNELQNVIMSVRMMPISSTFHKMTRIVRDTAKKLGKEAELVILGEETEVDKNMIDSLGDPLMHIVRNSMDHGLEDTRDERAAAGKSPVGRITLEARNSGSDVIISCSDDGRGLDRDKILAKARKNGLLTRPDADYSDREIYQFIMLPGFSTNDQVTELSGRGVGMDVVKKNIEKIGGTVQLDSEPGKGMTVTIRIPLTLAILQAIEIKVGSNFYLIPTLNIRESFKPAMKDIIVDPEGNEMILFRGECFAINRLGRLFGVPSNAETFDQGIMIMVEDEGRMAGLFADELVSEQQAVVKPIPSFITERIGQIRGISGCTIMGDGNIDLIIDVKSLTL